MQEHMNILATGGAGYSVGHSTCRYPESKIIIHGNLSKGRLENISLRPRECPNVTLILWENTDIRNYAKFKAARGDTSGSLVSLAACRVHH